MKHFTAATRGLNGAPGFLKQTERLFRDANAAWIGLTDFGCELSILGDAQSTSSSLAEAIEELDTALLHGHTGGIPDGHDFQPITDGVWGVNMADPVRRAKAVPESL